MADLCSAGLDMSPERNWEGKMAQGWGGVLARRGLF